MNETYKPVSSVAPLSEMEKLVSALEAAKDKLMEAMSTKPPIVLGDAVYLGKNITAAQDAIRKAIRTADQIRYL